MCGAERGIIEWSGELLVRHTFAACDRRFLKAFRRVQPETIYLNGMFSFFGAIVPLLSIPLLSQRLVNADTRIVIAPRGMLKQSALSMKRWKKLRG